MNRQTYPGKAVLHNEVAAHSFANHTGTVNGRGINQPPHAVNDRAPAPRRT